MIDCFTSITKNPVTETYLIILFRFLLISFTSITKNPVTETIRGGGGDPHWRAGFTSITKNPVTETPYDPAGAGRRAVSPV